MAIAHFITHPEVVIDPTVPVTAWPLSSEGIRRTRMMLGQPWVARVRAIFCSAEQKARDTAGIMADHLSLLPVVIDGLGENERSATGYLQKVEFEVVADQFFGRPAESVRGWERAIDAQARIVGAVDRAISMAPEDGDIAIISHGGVGALLLCHLKGVPISRTEDQPAGGGGNVFWFETTTRRLLTGWRRIDEQAPVCRPV
ncbi:MAG TPA: histidine phosphatase family protein [Acetobacteraceae bacterium]